MAAGHFKTLFDGEVWARKNKRRFLPSANDYHQDSTVGLKGYHQ